MALPQRLMQSFTTNRIAMLLLIVVFVMIGISPSLGHSDERRTSELMCTYSGFFTFQAEEVIGQSVPADGSGLLSCQNERGFAVSYAVHGDMTVGVPEDFKLTHTDGEISFSLNSTTFVIPREVAQLQDLYVERTSLSHASGMNESTFLMRGQKNDLVIETKLSMSQLPAKGIEIKNLSLRFDDSAPDIF